jgi:hypothetical protein
VSICCQTRLSVSSDSLETGNRALVMTGVEQRGMSVMMMFRAPDHFRMYWVDIVMLR